MRIEIAYKSDLTDGRATRTAHRLSASLGIPVSRCRIIDVYLVEGVPGFTSDLGAALFCEPVSQVFLANSHLSAEELWWDGAIEIAYKPGVTDPVAITAREAIELELGYTLPENALVQQARQYLLSFECPQKDKKNLAEVLQNAASKLHNPLIQRSYVIFADSTTPPSFPFSYPGVSTIEGEPVQFYDIIHMSNDELVQLSTERLLALTLDEMITIQNHYRNPLVQKARTEMGLPLEATDIELEMLGQTWSEHCKHKIFAANVRYFDEGATEPVTFRGLFKEFIKKTTDDLTSKRTDLRSVFHDNSGVVDFDDEMVMCFKAETHNSPSALDPYGGAITGIVGVNRDILGTGKGAWPFFNTNVLCFGHPDTPSGEIPQGLLHPRTVMAGVHEGIIDGGNQSGIPVAGGAFLFDESYLGKPLVFCGTGGLMPKKIRGEESWIQHIDAGDLAIMVGGRIGKDGIHGATFSSLELDETSPTSAVQIGDPITQRKMIDFILEARDLGLYKGITDNGAGGLSSSLGEMATYSGGIQVDLDKAPLKYPGLSPWEIWVSESQERMSLALDSSTLEAFLDLAKRRGVEATVVGRFTDDGFIDLRYQGKTLGLLTMDFVHDGLPAMELSARWISSPTRRPTSKVQEFYKKLPSSAQQLSQSLLDLLIEPNIRSKESLVRQYDHEVQGRSIIKPFTGPGASGPTDGGVLRPRLDSDQGVSVTHGVCPRVSDDDAYNMAVLAVDEAYRSHIALGGHPHKASGLDNFCWPDPVESSGTPDGAYKMAQLVRANQGLRDACLAYTLPLVSGKDSMKNDVRLGGKKVSVRPTLLVSLFGIVPRIQNCISSDFKTPGHILYLLGTNRAVFGLRDVTQRPTNQPGTFALGGSYLEKILAGPQPPAASYGSGFNLGASPTVDLTEAPGYYQAVAQALELGLLTSIHDLSDGGLAVCLAESAIGGNWGAAVDLGPWAELSGAGPAELLFNEEPTRFLVSIPPEKATELERVLAGFACIPLGKVLETNNLHIYTPDLALELPLTALASPWQMGWEE